MGWFDDIDLGSIFDDIGSEIVEVGKEFASDIEFKDVLAGGAVLSSAYFANEQLKQQEEQFEQSRQDALAALADDPLSYASNPEADQATVDIGESDIITREDYVDSEQEKSSNVGKVKKKINTTPKSTRKSLLVPQKSGVTL